jgi:mycothiol synthase
MVRVVISPPEAHAAMGESAELHRLVTGDALDQAMYASSLLTMVLRQARAAGAARVVVEVQGAGDVHDQMAAANGLHLDREILRLRRDLPAEEAWELDVRPFRVNEDAEAWLEVNNRAFAWHPDQRDFTIDRLLEKEAEPWFDPDGFLVHEIDGRMAGFCWTRIHADERPPLGEIFVIGVDPDFQGRGLGRPLVLAGLDWLAKKGLRNGILYTESSNVAARTLYDKLGFEENAVNRWWSTELGP